MSVGLVIEMSRDACQIWSYTSQRIIMNDTRDLPADVRRGDWVVIREAGQLEHITFCERQLLKVLVRENAIAVRDWVLLDVPRPPDGTDDDSLYAFSAFHGFVPLSRRFRLPENTKGRAFLIYAEIERNGSWFIYDQRIKASISQQDPRDGDVVEDLESRMREEIEKTACLSAIPPSIAEYERKETTVLFTTIDRQGKFAFASSPYNGQFGNAMLTNRAILGNEQLRKGQLYRALVTGDRHLDGSPRLLISELDMSPIPLPVDLEIRCTRKGIMIWATAYVLGTNENGEPSSLFSTVVGLVHVDARIGHGILCRPGGFLRCLLMHHGRRGWSVEEILRSTQPPMPILPSPEGNVREEDYERLRGRQSNEGGEERRMGSLQGSLLDVASVREALAREGRLEEFDRGLEEHQRRQK